MDNNRQMPENNPQQAPIQSEPGLAPPSPTPQPETLVTPEKSKSKRRVVLGIISIVLLLMIAVATSWWFFFKQDSAAPTVDNTSPNTSSSETVTATPASVIAAVKKKLAEQYTLISYDPASIPNSYGTGPKEGESYVTDGANGPGYKADGYNFYTHVTGTDVGMGFWSNSTENLPVKDEKSARALIAAVYVDDFKLTEKDVQRYSDGTATNRIFTGNGLVCSVEPVDFAQGSTTAACANIADYSTESATLKPFADVLPASELDAYTTLRGITITNSTVTGYERAHVGVGVLNGAGASAFFYRKDNGEWKYLTTSQSPLTWSHAELVSTLIDLTQK